MKSKALHRNKPNKHVVRIIERVTRHLAIDGITVTYGSTRHPDWEHGYLSLQVGEDMPVSLGRMIFHKGVYSHTKYYGNVGNNYLRYKINWLIRFNIVIKPVMWGLIWMKAEAEANKRFEAKVKARAKLPPKKRRVLCQPNPINYVKLPDAYRTIIREQELSCNLWGL